MNRTDVLNRMVEASGVSIATADRALRGALAGMKESLVNGEKVTLAGFGTWTVVERAPRKGRNPKSGEEIDIPSKKAVKFTVGAPLAQAVNGE